MPAQAPVCPGWKSIVIVEKYESEAGWTKVTKVTPLSHCCRPGKCMGIVRVCSSVGRNEGRGCVLGAVRTGVETRYFSKSKKWLWVAVREIRQP